jgi:hypothetical protein
MRHPEALVRAKRGPRGQGLDARFRFRGHERREATPF